MLALAHLRAHGIGYCAAFLATTFGVALVSATLIVYDSSRPVVQPRLGEASALVLPAQAENEYGNEADFIPWSAREAQEIAIDLGEIPEVGAVVLDRSFYAQPFLDSGPVEDEGSEEAGHGWSSSALSTYALIDGAAPEDPDQIVVPDSLGVEVGAPISVNLAYGLRDFTVSGLLDGPGFWFADDVAAQMNPGVRAIGVIASTGQDIGKLTQRAAEALADRGTVVTGNERALLEPEHISYRRHLGDQLIVAMAVLGSFTTVLVVSSTIVLATSQRRREFGLLRTLGAGPGQLRRMVLGEAAVIGVGGGLVGAVLGVAGAMVLRAVLLNLGVQPPDFRVRISAWPLIVAVSTGMVVALIGAWAGSRSSTRAAPIEALRAATVDRRPMSRSRWGLGLVGLTGGVVVTVLAYLSNADTRVTTVFVAALLFVSTAAVLSPLVIGPMAGIVTWPFARWCRSAAPMLVRAESTAQPGRAAAIAAPVIAAVGFAVLLSGMVQAMAVAYPEERTAELRGLVLVRPDGAAGLSDEVVAATGAGPVGTRAGLPTRVFVEAADGDVAVVDGIGSLDERYAVRGQAVLDEPTASSLGVRSGESISVRFADGTTSSVFVSQVLPVDPARGPFVLPREQVRAHDPSALTDTVFLPQSRTPSGLPVGAVVEDAHSYAVQDYRIDARLTEWLATVLTVITVGYSGIAVANSIAMSAHRRGADTSVLTLSGATTGQLMATALAETTVVVSIGSLLGLAVTLLPLTAMAASLSRAADREVGLQVDWSTVFLAVAGCLVLALVGTIAATRRVMRT